MRSLFSRGLSVPVRPRLPVALGRGVGLRPLEASGRWGREAAALSVRQGRTEEWEGNTWGVEGRGQPSPSPPGRCPALCSQRPWAVPRLQGKCHHVLPELSTDGPEPWTDSGVGVVLPRWGEWMGQSEVN